MASTTTTEEQQPAASTTTSTTQANTSSSTTTNSPGDFIILCNNQCERGKQPSRHEITLPSNATINDLITNISLVLSYDPAIFQIKPYNTNIAIPTNTDQERACPISTYYQPTGKNPTFIVRRPDIDQADPRFLRGADAQQHEKILLSQSGYDDKPPPASVKKEHMGFNSNNNSITISNNNNSNYNFSMKYSSDNVYCGLSNQGATCYLNSLLQTLYMTPEFRTALYNWSFEDFARREFNKKLATTQQRSIIVTNNNNSEEPVAESEKENTDLNMQLNNKPLEEVFENYKAKLEENCIPRQLQKLFMKLNTSEKRAIKTKNLTKSFGWKQADAFTQHDVQELCRVLFDKVDKVWEGTEQANFINELYQGEMRDYVVCLNCQHESNRTDKFLDIPLVIRGFGETSAVTSIQEALHKFIEPEMLVEDNQYLCEKCSKKCDARKGLKLTRLPYLLCLQLKRFDFDFDKLSRIKLNDRVTFPEILDMNHFVNDPTVHNNNNNHEQMDIENQSKIVSEIPEGIEEKIIKTSQNGPNIEEALKNGPYVYVLYSVLIHRGSALGGHYFAYIKSFSKDKWFEFNDSSVREISANAYTSTFGDNDKKIYSNNNGTNAYMLMYRLYDPSRNMVELTKDNLPQNIKQIIEEENRKEKERELEKEREKSMCNVKLIYKDLPCEEVKINKNENMGKLKEIAVKHFNLEKYYPNNIRIRQMNWIGIPTDPISDEKLEKPLNENYYYSSSTPHQFYFETKEENEEWQKYSIFDSVVKCSGYNRETGTFSSFSFFTFPKDLSLNAVKEKLASYYNLPLENLVIVEEYSGQIKILDKEQLSFYTQSIGNSSSKFYIEQKSEDNVLKAAQHIEKLKNSLQISFTNPDEKEFKHVLSVDKRTTILELKKKIEGVINLSPDEFLVYRYYHDDSKSELKNEEDKLSSWIYGPAKLLIVKGRPLHKGEILCKFILYDITKDTRAELFHLILLESLTIFEVKEEVIKYVFNNNTNGQLKLNNVNFPKDPDRIRIRRYIVRPSTIYPSSKTLKEVLDKNYNYSTSEIIIQILPENQKEEKNSDEDIIVILRQFFPDKYELSSPVEIKLKKYEKIMDTRLRISEAVGIPPDQLSVAITDFDSAQKILSVPQLIWYPPPPDSDILKAHRHYYSLDPTRTLSSISHIDDGSVLICRNMSVPLKKLTDEEEKKISNDEDQKRHLKYRSHRKEDSLSINIKDVPIFDNPTDK